MAGAVEQHDKHKFAIELRFIACRANFLRAAGKNPPEAEVIVMRCLQLLETSREGGKISGFVDSQHVVLR